MAEHERDQIGARTKAALAAAKARGVKLGSSGPANLRRNVELRRSIANDFALRHRAILEALQARGLSQRAMVTELNGLDVRAPQGGSWSLVQVQRALRRGQHRAKQTS